MNDPRGSRWRKWDLHVHTPASYHQQFGEDWGEFVDALRNKAVAHDIEVAVVNDYFSVDGYAQLVDTFCEEKFPCPALALSNGKKLYLMPGIELRLSIFDHDEDAVNVHIVFDPKFLPDNIRNGFIEKLSVKYGRHKLHCKNDDLTKIGYAIDLNGRYDENLDIRGLNESEIRILRKKAHSLITLDVDDVDQGLKRLEESLASFEQRFYLRLIAYKGHGSLSGFDWYNVARQEGRPGNTKRTLLNSADICFSNSPSDRSFLLGLDARTPPQEILDRFRTLKPCVWGSDSHSLDTLFHPSNGATSDYTWIKADPTFEGLRQILYEPETRVYIGIMPDKLINVEDAKHQFIESIAVASTKDDGEWFDRTNPIPLNSGLISIIGNKGAGKSALADIIAATGNCENDSYSFLLVDKFLKLDRANKFSSLIHFLDGTSDTKSFNESEYDPGKPSRVVYLSQSFVRDLCESEDVAKLQKEIYRVLSSHLPEEEKGDFEDLNEIIRNRSAILDESLAALADKLDKLNEEIVKFELYGHPDFRESKQRKFEERKKELGVLEEQVKQLPGVNTPQNEENKAIADEVTTLRKSVAELRQQSLAIQEQLNLVASEAQQVQSLISEITLQSGTFSELASRLATNPLLKKYAVPVDALIEVRSNFAPLNDLVERLGVNLNSLRRDKEVVEHKITLVVKSIKEKEGLLGTREHAYQKYQGQLRQWEERRNNILGDSKSADSLKNLERWIEFIDKELPSRISELLANRNALVGQILSALLNKKTIFDSLFSYSKAETDAIAEDARLPASELIQFKINLKFSHDFDNRFLEMISQNRSGSFYGKDTGLKELKRLKNTVNFDDASSIAAFPEAILNALKYDLKKEEPEKTLASIDEQLTDAYKLPDLYDFLFGLSYIDIAVEIEHKGRILEHLSPGEKGTVLLIFYLLLDKDRRPLIIDQPEENLDNQTIFLVLVPLIKRAKQERQLIIVTHNPNLAVVCDSEQIIHASMNKENRNLVEYQSGSIEKSHIRESSIDILEGTRPAFSNRQSKYRILGGS